MSEQRGPGGRPVDPGLARLRLVAPSLGALEGYARALQAGWSPDEDHDLSEATLHALRRDPTGFVANLLDQSGTFVTPDGQSVPRIPFRMFWLDDGDFAGTINLRWMPGTERLPPYISGHIGYAVVPWRRRRGYATRAVRLILAEARDQGLARVLITCDDTNLASRGVILAAGGEPAGAGPHPVDPRRRKLLFWVRTDSEPPA